jgi:hypothetical protein
MRARGAPQNPEFQYDAAEKWHTLCGIYKIPLQEVESKLTALAKKLNLPDSSPVWDRVILSLENRKRNNLSATLALTQLHTLNDPKIINDLTDGMQQLQDRFIAMMAAQDFDPGTYHFYGHAKEMSQDPGSLIANTLAPDSVNNFIIAMTNALGAAHDIIQNYGAPRNEILSAELFVAETQNMINVLLEKNRNKYTEDQIEKLESFKADTLPFLAEECIVNSTYMVFQAGKRDLDNILNQINQIFDEAAGRTPKPMRLSKEIHAMKTAITLADTRRSEIKPILAKYESIRTALLVSDSQSNLTRLLRAAGILGQDELMPDYEQMKNAGTNKKLMEIEGFLLRLGQNLRMTSELAVHFSQDALRKELINDLREFKEVEITLEYHLQPFLNAIDGSFGEAAFAAALGEIDNSELKEQIKQHHLEEMVNSKNFDFNGWKNHATHLTNFKAGIESFSLAEQAAITQLMYTIAAKSPGHKVGQKTYDAMQEYRKELSYNNPALLPYLDSSMTQVGLADSGISLSEQRPHQLQSYHSRPRFYSQPQVSRTLPDNEKTKSNEKRKSGDGKTNKLPSIDFEIGPTKPITRRSSLTQTKDTLPPIKAPRRSR